MTRRKSIKLSTPNEVRKALSRIANMVLNAELDPKSANAITLICNAILGSMKQMTISEEGTGSMKTDKQYKLQSLLRMAEITGDGEKRVQYLEQAEKLIFEIAPKETIEKVFDVKGGNK